MRRLLIGCLMMLVFLASTRCAAEPTPTPEPPKWSAQVPEELGAKQNYVYIRIESGTPEEVLADFQARYPDWVVELRMTGKDHITVAIWDPTKYTPRPTSTAGPPAPIGTPQHVTSYRGVRVGMPADDVLKAWGKGLRSKEVGSDAQGLIVEWIYEDAILVMKRWEIGGVTCYRVAEICLR